MDWETSLLCLGLVIGSAFLLFIISTLGTRGQSYEEVVAANRRLVAQRGLLDDPVKQKRLQQQQTKKNKKAGKKVKEQQAKEQAAANGEMESEAQADNDADEDSPGQYPRGHVEFINTPSVPEEMIRPQKEKIEVPKAKDPKASKPGKQEKVKAPAKQEKEKEKLVKASVEEVKSSPEPTKSSAEPKEQRKSKNRANQPSHEDADVIVKPAEDSLVVSSLPISQPADLTTDKILKQAYPLETLTNNVAEVQPVKQIVPVQIHPAPVKSKKKKNELAQYQQLIMCPEGVNVNLLVKLLGEAPLSRSEIQIVTDCLLNKQNGPLPEHSEWSEGPKDPLIKLKKQLSEKEKAFTSEQEASQALQAKLKELRATLNAERTRCTQVTQASEETANSLRVEMAALQTRIQRGIDENNTLRQQVHQYQTKAAAEAELTTQRNQMEMHIQVLSETNTSLTGSVTSLQNENTELKNANAAVTNELQMSLEHKREFEEANKIYADKEQILKQQLVQANDRLQSLSEAQSEIIRLNAAQTITQQQSLQHEKRQEELDRQNQQLMTEINKLKTEKEDLSHILSELKEQIALQPTPNGTTSPDKNDTVDVEKAIADACNELEEKHSQQLDSLQRQLDQHRDKNNELRTKNWKVMEALQAAEKKLLQLESQKTTEDSTLREAVTKACLDEQSSTKEVLERLFPQVSVQGKTHKEWLDTFTEEANAYLLEATKPAVVTVAPTQELPNNERLKELEIKNHQLQCLVDNYKGIVVDTEKTLSRLQGHVTEEEQKWKTQLVDKQKELEGLKQSVVQMKSETVSLQSMLDHEQKLRQESEIHARDSLATRAKAPPGLGDVERVMEENTRLKELVEKLQNPAQSLNGPSQLLPITTYNRKATKKRRSITGWLRRKITFKRRKNKEMRAVDQETEPLARQDGYKDSGINDRRTVESL
ncbi:uncharacterized protein LOC143920974 isoform X2 [Arctopsyche grandis]|uniref:uncharacterized protein LOC143920974 isoform X2 n=1 Tax=Arctopsyche grandis TaxID=121162 RepID=UPI00406D7643